MTGLEPVAVMMSEPVWISIVGAAKASGRDPLQLTLLLSGISDHPATRYCAEIGPGGYDEQQALEGAAGSAGRTESTSVSM